LSHHRSTLTAYTDKEIAFSLSVSGLTFIS
jgi:hypothetical protein